jgi:hypothetical protein
MKWKCDAGADVMAASELGFARVKVKSVNSGSHKEAEFVDLGITLDKKLH